MAEQYVPFRRELAAMVVLDSRRHVTLDTVETIQTNHVCDFTFPSEISALGPAYADATALAAIKAVQGQGLFGVELFETADGELLINEIAPRPHNTGHYTLDWGAASQFEYHVRVVTGMPFDEQPKGSGVLMANLLGQTGAGDYRRGLRAALEQDPEGRVHWYGKAESKVGRKMGHINLPNPQRQSSEDMLPRLSRIRQAFYAAWTAG
jgi:5-(carboxyamino)imidazole ribonucleotide synthase